LKTLIAFLCVDFASKRGEILCDVSFGTVSATFDPITVSQAHTKYQWLYCNQLELWRQTK
jgi:hypothetical protein